MYFLLSLKVVQKHAFHQAVQKTFMVRRAHHDIILVTLSLSKGNSC